MDSGKKKADWQKRQLILALVTTALLAVVLGTLAWFRYTRQLQTVTAINVPSLWLEGANGQDISTVDLGEIDVEDGTYRRRYVFAVASKDGENYYLQLAHTTNIPFTYTIYESSTESSSGTDFETVDGTDYFVGKKVTGSYLNPSEGDPKLADKTYHDETYGAYGNVQKNAEPLYWKSASQSFTQSSLPYISYYVLEVNWEGQNIYNTKETDLIYLMAVTAAESSSASGSESENGE